MPNISTLPKIKDLIEVPAVKTVIELATVRDAGEADLAQLVQLVESFVVTADIERSLRVILSAIVAEPEHGVGIFLTGNFGSGKSHFLSVLSLLLQQSWAWKPIAEQSEALGNYAAPLGERRLLIVQIPLLEYRQADTLEELIWLSIERALAKPPFGVKTSLAPDSTFVDLFAKYVLPAHRSEIAALLEVRYQHKGEWEALRSASPDDALRAAQEYLRTTGQTVPFRLTLDRQAAWEKLANILSSHGIDGLVLLIDELSEFLRSKADARALNEDTRFLQFLGERATHFPVWVVAALQEAIEKTGDISQTTFNKIKDRYPYRLELSTRHLRELIDRRLIVKKGEDAIEAIRHVYRRLKDRFQRLQIDEETFVQTYPVHPETLELLDTNSRFFSQRRGVIDFIHCQVRGDASRQTPGILELDADNLLTPDKIFDHFAIRLREQIDLNPYYELFTTYFDRHLPRLFEDESDQTLASRLVKLLILLKLSPIENRRTVRELADMLLVRAVEFGGDLNYEYIESVLKRLHADAGYLRVVPGDAPFSDVYEIDVAANVVEQARVRVRDIVQALSDTDGRILNTVFERIVDGSIPFGHLNGVYSERKNIPWENTLRSGWVKLCNLLEIPTDEMASAHDKLRQSEGDFVLYIGLPFDVEAQREHFERWLENMTDPLVNGLVCWLPAPIEADSELQSLKQFHAHVQVSKDLRNDPSGASDEMQQYLNEWIAENELRVRTQLEERYFAGKLYTASGQLRRNLGEWRFLPFNALLARLIQKPLRDTFPKHIAPQCEINAWRIVTDVVDSFIRPGELERLEGTIQELTESICAPFKLALKRRKHYQLRLDATQPIFAEILALFDPDNGSLVAYHQAYWHLRKSEYGVITPLFDLLLFALIRQGYLIAYQGGVRVQTAQVKLPLAQTVEYLGKGELIDDAYRSRLNVVAQTFLNEALANYDIGRQEEVWEKLCKLKERLSSELAAGRQQLQAFGDRVGFANTPTDSPLSRGRTGEAALTGALEQISQLQRILAEIKPALNAKAGLEHLVQTLTDRKLLSEGATPNDTLTEVFRQSETIRQFTTGEAEALLALHSYLSSPHLSIPDMPDYHNLLELKQTVESRLRFDERLLSGGAAEIIEAFQLFRDSYAERYFLEHNRANRVDAPALEKIRSTPAYRLLKKLSQLHALPLSVDWATIDAQITQAQGRVCNRLTRGDLSRIPSCVCGFRLGEAPQPLDVARLFDTVHEAIQKAVEALHAPSNRERVETYIAQLAQVEADAPITELIALMDIAPSKLTEATYPTLEALLTPGTLAHLNKALEGGVKIVRRDLSKLVEALAGKQYRRGEFWRVIEAWLDSSDDVGDDVFFVFDDEA